MEGTTPMTGTQQLGEQRTVHEGVVATRGLGLEVGGHLVGGARLGQREQPTRRMSDALRPQGAAAVTPPAADVLAHVARPAVDHHRQLALADPQVEGCRPIDHLRDVLHLDEVVASADGAEPTVTHPAVLGHQVVRRPADGAAEGAQSHDALGFGLHLVDVGGRHAAAGAVAQGIEPPEQPLREQRAHGRCGHGHVAGAIEEVAHEVRNEAVPLGEEPLHGQIDDVQAHAAVDVAAHGRGQHQPLGGENGADGHAAVARVQVGCAGHGHRAASVGMAQATEGSELAGRLALQRQVSGQEDAGGHGVRVTGRAHGEHGAVDRQIEALASQGAHEARGTEGGHDETKGTCRVVEPDVVVVGSGAGSQQLRESYAQLQE